MFQSKFHLILNKPTRTWICFSLHVSESTLSKRLREGVLSTTLSQFCTTFTEQQQLELAAHCHDLDQRLSGLSLQALRKLEFQYAEMNGIPYRFSKPEQMARRKWATNFLKSEQLAISTSMRTSIARVMASNPQQVNLLFNQFTNNQIYNVDEIGFSTV